MEMSISRKALNVAAIFDYIIGSLEIILCIIAVVGGITGLAGTGQGIYAVIASLGAATIAGFGFVMGFEGLMSILTGYLSRRAVKDPTKVMPIWVVTLISMLLNAGDIIIDYMNGVPASAMSGNFLGLAIAVVIFVIVNNIRKEAHI